MFVIKRDGTRQPIDFEKIHWRIKSMCALPEILNFQKEQRPDAYALFSKLSPIHHANVDTITKKTIEGIYNNIPTTEIDKLSAEIAQEMCTIHPDNSILATRILVSNLQKNVLENMIKRFPQVPESTIKENLFSYVMLALYFNKNKHGEHAPLVSPYVVAIAHKYADKIRELVDFSRDFTNHDYLGIKTLEKGYLFRVYSMEGFDEANIILETPSISDLRIAIGIACAPTPCPELYSDASSFITSHPEVVKEKYRNNVLVSHKDKAVNTKLFKSLYWQHKLNEEMNSFTLKDSQWNMICNIYNGMSTGKFTPATPTRFSAGTLNPQGSSCFLIAMKDDSLKGIYETLLQQSQISKHAGGVGIWVSNVRSTGSYISGTNGISNGLKPMLQVFDSSSSYVDQGGGKRPGSTSIYLEPWHADILTFLKLKRKKGADSDRARGLFYALWTPDEFFRCWKEKKDWYLFDPSVCPKLYNSYDEKFSPTYLSDEFLSDHKQDYLFTYRYRKYIRQGKYESKILPESLMEEVVETVKDSGVPYMLAKDACNRKSNQKNLGVIKSSNLCTEIIQYSDEKETAVCNLSSICLNRFVREWREGDSENFKYNTSLSDDELFLTFDWNSFAFTVRMVQNNIDRLIDLNYYPTPESRVSNMRHRAQGVGIQGEADMMAMLRLPWNSKEAHKLRFYIFERMYYECLKASVELAKANGPYETFQGSPASLGKLQFDLWKDEGKKISFPFTLSWDELREDIKKYGLRNSLFIAPMPTASTASVLGNSPSIEPFNSLVYIRKAGAGDVTIMNQNLVNDLMSLNIWNKSMSDKILQNHGSIQDIIEIPKKLRDSYLTAYDLEPKDIIDAAFVRAWFVDQSQSMNLFFKNVTMSELSKAWTQGWIRGLKTLSYYCRTRGAITAQKAQIEVKAPNSPIRNEGKVCSRDDPSCLSCGS